MSNGCVLIGHLAGSNLELASFNNVFLGTNSGATDFSGTDVTAYSNSVAIGNDAHINGSDEFQLGNSSQTVYSASAISTRSDERDKTDIAPLDCGLGFVLKLKPKKNRYYCHDETGTLWALCKICDRLQCSLAGTR